ncbi:hypothetical protein PV326_002222 [Microctonus aethiopoides]|nr:hypothetical protein PV326_002222 [Microctonus aethiopoides]
MKCNNGYGHVGLKYWQNNIKHIERQITFKKILRKVKKKLEGSWSDRKIARHIKQLSTQPTVNLRRINIPGPKYYKRNQNDFDLESLSDKIQNNIDELNVDKISEDQMPISFTGVSSTVDDFVEEKVSSKSTMLVDPDLFDIEPRSKLDNVKHDVFKLKAVEYCSSYEYKKRFKKITLSSIKYTSSKDIPFGLDPRKIRQLLRECHAELLSKITRYCGPSILIINTYHELKNCSVYKKRLSSVRNNGDDVKRARYATNICDVDNVKALKHNGTLKQKENILKKNYCIESSSKRYSTKMDKDIYTSADKVSSQLYDSQSPSKKRDNSSNPFVGATESDTNVRISPSKHVIKFNECPTNVEQEQHVKTFSNKTKTRDEEASKASKNKLSLNNSDSESDNRQQVALSRGPTRICTAKTPRISRLIAPEINETISDSLVSSTIDKNDELTQKPVQNESLSDKLKRVRDTIKVENSRKTLRKIKPSQIKLKLKRKMFDATFDSSFLSDIEDHEPNTTITSTFSKDESEDDVINTNDSSDVDESEDGSTITKVSRNNPECKERKRTMPDDPKQITKTESDTSLTQDYHRKRKLERSFENDSNINDRYEDNSKRQNARNSIDSDISINKPSPASSPWSIEAKISSNTIVDDLNTAKDAGDDTFTERLCGLPLESSSRRQSSDDNISLEKQTKIFKASDKSLCNESNFIDDEMSIVNKSSDTSSNCLSLPTIDFYETEKIFEEHLVNTTSRVATECAAMESDNTELLAINNQVILNSNDSANAKLSNYYDEEDEILDDENSLRIVDEHLYDKFSENSSGITVISKAHTTGNVSTNEIQITETSSVNSQSSENNCLQKEIIQKASVGIMGKINLPSKKRQMNINNRNISDSLQLPKENSSSSQVEECNSINDVIPQDLNYDDVKVVNSKMNNSPEQAKRDTVIVSKLSNSPESKVSNSQHTKCDPKQSITTSNQDANINPTLMTHKSKVSKVNSPKRSSRKESQLPSFPVWPKPITEIPIPIQFQHPIQTQWNNMIPFQLQNPNFPQNSTALQQPLSTMLPMPNNLTSPTQLLNLPSYFYEIPNKMPSNNSTIVSNPGPSRLPTQTNLPSVPGPSSSASIVQLPPMNFSNQPSFNQSQLHYKNFIPQQSTSTINQEIPIIFDPDKKFKDRINMYLDKIIHNVILYRRIIFMLRNSPADIVKSNQLNGQGLKLICATMDSIFNITTLVGHPSIDYTFVYAEDRFEKMMKEEFKITYDEMAHMLVPYFRVLIPHALARLEIPNAVLARKKYNQFIKQKISDYKLILASSQQQVLQFSTQSTSNNGLAGMSGGQMHQSRPSLLQPLPAPPPPAPPKKQRQSNPSQGQSKSLMTPSHKAIFELQVQMYCEISKWIETELNKEHSRKLYKQSVRIHEYEKTILAEQQKKIQKINNQQQNSLPNVSAPNSNVNNEQQLVLPDNQINQIRNESTDDQSTSQNIQSPHVAGILQALNQFSTLISNIDTIYKASIISSVEEKEKNSGVEQSTSHKKTSHKKKSKKTKNPQDLISNEKEKSSKLLITEAPSTSGVLATINSSSQVDEPRDHLITPLQRDDNQNLQQHEPNPITHNTNDDNINEKNEIQFNSKIEKQDENSIDITEEFIKNELALLSETVHENENYETENIYDDGTVTLADLPNLSIPNLKFESSVKNETLNKSNDNSSPELIILDDDSLDCDNDECASVISSDRETIVISRDTELDDIIKHNQSLIDEELECEALSKQLGIIGPTYVHDESPIKYDNPVITGVMTIDSNAFENIDKNGHDILVNDDFIDITDIGIKLERNMVSSPLSNCSDKTVIGFIGEDIKNASHQPDCSNCKINKAIVMCECGEIAYCSDSCLGTHWPDFHASICKGAQININTIEEITLDDD